jgi:hypothetical protein
VHTIDSHDRVHELPDVPLPSSGAPDPIVLADEDTLVITYITATPSSRDSDGSGQPSAGDVATIVVFRQCYASHFGPPNDESFATHHLADRGLRPCGAFEVQSSSWLRDLEVRNRGHPRHDPRLFQQLRHWVWTFRDSVLECAALTYTVVKPQGLPDDLLPQMYGQLRSS